MAEMATVETGALDRGTRRLEVCCGVRGGKELVSCQGEE